MHALSESEQNALVKNNKQTKNIAMSQNKGKALFDVPVSL